MKIIDEGMLDYRNQETFANIEVVDFASLVADSSKLKYLDAVRIMNKPSSTSS